MVAPGWFDRAWLTQEDQFGRAYFFQRQLSRNSFPFSVFAPALRVVWIPAVIADVLSAASADVLDLQVSAEAQVACGPAAPADPDLDDPPWVAGADDSDEPVASMAGRVYQAWMVDMADCHRDDFPAGYNLAGCPVRTADDCSRDDCTEDEADDNFADGSANRRDSPDGWTRRSAAVDTRGAAAGKGYAIPPTRRGCSRRDAIPSSIPSRPIPKAGCPPAAPRFRSPRRN